MMRVILAFIAFLFLSITAQAKTVEITVNKVGQKMTVRVDGRLEYVWAVSSGAQGYTTPSGSFKPFRLEEDHFSKEWDDAPMPHAIFFTERGHAIHGSFSVKSLGRPVSHGCVRLHPDNAAILFDLVQEAGLSNTRVIVKGGFFDFGYSPKRTFADVGSDIDKTIKKTRRPGGFASLFGSSKKKPLKTAKKPVKKDTKVAAIKKTDPKLKKVAAVKKAEAKPKQVAAVEKKTEAKPKKLAEKCVTKDGKKVCTAIKTASN